MKLESLLKPAKYADEQILRYYSKLTRRWEDKGHSRYSLSGICDLISIFALPLINPIPPILGRIMFPIIISSLSLSIVGHLTGHDGIKQEGERYIIENPIKYYINKFGKIIRTPELVSGFGFVGKGAYDIYNYFSTREGSLNEGINNLLLGVSFMSNSSAWYIRDSDPKLLDKAPFWKTAYNWTKEKVKSLIPSPEPIPTPSLSIGNYLPIKI